MLINYKYYSQNIIQLTFDNTKYTRSQWSPNGEIIAFTDENCNKLFIINKDGSNKEVLLEDEGVGYKFVWSEDNKEIAYRGTKSNMQYIGIVEIISKKNQIISKEGKRIQPPFWTYYNNGKIVGYIVNDALLTSDTLSYSKNFQFKNYRNLNKTLYFKSDGLYLINEEGILVKFTDNIAFDPVFSPDKTKVVYFDYESQNLVVINVDGSNRINIGNGNHPSWSPDGNNIVYQITIDGDHKIIGSDLFIYDVLNKTSIKITDTPDEIEDYPSWSPNGESIIYNSLISGQLYKIIL